MRPMVRDGVETLFVLAAAVYAVWAAGSALTGMSTRTIAIIVLALGWVGCTANQREMTVVFGLDRNRVRPPMTYIVIATALGLVALLAGIWAIAAASEPMLLTLLAAMVTLWAISTVRHGVARPGEAASKRTPQMAGRM